jgi:SAM-dependent methyltransferase
MVSRGWEVTGCDVSPGMIEQARAKVDDSVRLHVADMRSLPRFSEFDLVWALGDVVNYLSTVEELTQALRGMRDNLAPGGMLVIDAGALFDFRHFFAETRVIEGDGGRLLWDGKAPPDATPGGVYEAHLAGEGIEFESHVHRQRHFPEAEILTAISRAGLECQEVFGYGDDVILTQPLNEEEHTRGLYVATA